MMVWLKFSFCLICSLVSKRIRYWFSRNFKCFFKIPVKSLAPNDDPDLRNMINETGAINGNITITSIKPLGTGNFGFVLPGLILYYV